MPRETIADLKNRIEVLEEDCNRCHRKVESLRSDRDMLNRQVIHDKKRIDSLSEECAFYRGYMSRVKDTDGKPDEMRNTHNTPDDPRVSG